MRLTMDTVMVGLLLAAAVGYLFFCVVRKLRGKGPKCGGCGPAAASKSTTLTLGGQKLK